VHFLNRAGARVALRPAGYEFPRQPGPDRLHGHPATPTKNSVLALARPDSKLWWLGSRRVNQLNNWQFNDKDGNELSPAGVIFIRAIGCGLLVVATALMIMGIGNFSADKA